MPEHQQTQQSKKANTIFQNQATPVRQTPVSNPYSIIQRAKVNPRSLTRADIMQLQRTIGNQAVGRLLSSIGSSSTAQHAPVQRQEMPEEEKCPSCMQRQEIPEEEEPLQGKMIETVQRQEIPEEEESLQGKFENKPEIDCPSCSAAPIVQRQETPEEEEPLQGKFESIQRQEILEEEKTLQTKKENNTGMPDNLKAGVENLSGIDMSDVRVHYNSSKPAEVGALAYTQGKNIHVAPGQERHLPHEAWHVVQQKQGRVMPLIKLKNVSVNNDKDLENEADLMGVRAKSIQSLIVQRKFAKRTIQLTTFPVVLQARFYERTNDGYVWWRLPMQVYSMLGYVFKPGIDPATGTQEIHNGYGVWFQFDKAHTSRQKVKGRRVAGNTTGIELTLGGGLRPPWPPIMQRPKSAFNVRAALAGRRVPQSPDGGTSWGHQLAHRWGGRFEQWNAASVTNSGRAGENAQEGYQTAVEEAVKYVSQNTVPPLHAPIPLNHFRLKHTAYLYPGTNVAKYMRIKIFQVLDTGNVVKLIDQTTPDFAKKLTTDQFRFQLIQQIARQGALLTKKTTDPAQVLSVNVASGTP